MKHNNNPQWFTLLLILWIVWFLLILLTGIYKVVLFELGDTKDMSHFMKSRTASESWWEIAMLKLKEKRFGYHGAESYDTEWESIMLSQEPLDPAKFNKNRDVYFGYEIDSKASKGDDGEYRYEGNIAPGEFHIVPLFYIEDTWIWRTANPDLNIPLELDETTPNWAPENLVWNIIGVIGWLSGQWEFRAWSTNANLKMLNDTPDHVSGAQNNQGFVIENVWIEDFLRNMWEESDDEYLTLFNVGDVAMKYILTTGDGESFTKPITTVYTSAKIGDIKQNIQLEIDNSKYFDVLKYSIYDY